MAGPNLTAAGQLAQAPPSVAGPNVPGAQVKVPSAGQLGQAPPANVPAVGPDVPVQPGNDPAQQMVCDSSSPDNDPAPAQMLPDPPPNVPAIVQNQPVAPDLRPGPNRRPTG